MTLNWVKILFGNTFYKQKQKQNNEGKKKVNPKIIDIQQIKLCKNENLRNVEKIKTKSKNNKWSIWNWIYISWGRSSWNK